MCRKVPAKKTNADVGFRIPLRIVEDKGMMRKKFRIGSYKFNHFSKARNLLIGLGERFGSDEDEFFKWLSHRPEYLSFRTALEYYFGDVF